MQYRADTTPKSNRLHVAIFGRTNVGKSSFLNFMVGQDVAITSHIAGTTTDVVEKNMELLPIGPVVFLDTAGLDDKTSLADKRLEKTKKVLDRADVCVVITEANGWTDYEETILSQAKIRKTPVLAVINKTDIKYPDEAFTCKIRAKSLETINCTCLDKTTRETTLNCFKTALLNIMPEGFLREPPLISDLVQIGGIAVLVVPIDMEAPKGRLILPQVQAIREVLDSDAVSIVVKERELSFILQQLKQKPDIVVCDSQAVSKVCADTPENIKLTTFSILYSRYKGDICEMARGAARIHNLKPADKVLIAESCTHHPIGDDIGRVKIPGWLNRYLGFTPKIEICSGKDYPENISDYALVIHCGACMFNRKHMLTRLEQAKSQHVPITNYGICISILQGVVKRTLSPFPEALAAYKNSMHQSGDKQ